MDETTVQQMSPAMVLAQLEVMAARLKRYEDERAAHELRVRQLEAEARVRAEELRESLMARDQVVNTLSEQARLYEAEMLIAVRALQAIVGGDDGAAVIAASALAQMPMRLLRQQ
jgi:hypothetical protein